MPRQKKHRLFEVGKATPDRRAERAKQHHADRLWTGNKARLIQAYLVRFVQVTKHGTYIDGFAGPQHQGVPESWTANLVVGPSGPQLLQHFLLFDIKDSQVRALEALAGELPDRHPSVFRRLQCSCGRGPPTRHHPSETGHLSSRPANL